MKTSDLKKLPQNRLYEIIYRYDSQVANLREEQKELVKQTKTQLCELGDLKGQMKFMKETNRLISEELHALKSNYWTPESAKNSLFPKSEKNTLKPDSLDNGEQHFGDLENALICKFKTQIRQLIMQVSRLESENATLSEYKSAGGEVNRLKYINESLVSELKSVKNNLGQKIAILKEALRKSQAKNIAKNEKINIILDENTELARQIG